MYNTIMGYVIEQADRNDKHILQIEQDIRITSYNVCYTKLLRDTLAKLSDIIDQSANMLANVDMEVVKIKNAQDMRFITQNMLDAIKIYGDTVLKAQRFGAVENDPSLLKPTTINVNVKSALTDRNNFV